MVKLSSISDIAPPFTIFTTELLGALSPAGVLGTVLANNSGVVVDISDSASSWPLFISNMPNTPHNAGCIYDTSGMLDGIIMPTGNVIEHYGIQLRVRALSYQTGWAKMKEIVAFVQNIRNTVVTIGSQSYKIIHNTRTTPIISIGYDEQRRIEFTVNFLTTITEP